MNAAICLRLCLLFLRISRWVPIAIVFLISAFVYYAYCFYTVHALTEQWNVRIALIAVFHVLLFMFLFAYLSAVMNSVPKMPSKFYLSDSVVEHELSAEKSDYGRNVILYRHAMENALPIENVSMTNGPRYCPVCKCIKADRCHHCSLCSACVLKYDHHCPWINNCVHHQNYKSFVLFLFYGLTLCIFVLLSSLPTLIIQWNEEAKSYLLIQKFIMVFLPFIALLFGCSFGCLLIYHMVLIFKNRTTIEQFLPPHFEFGPDINAYDLGTYNNFKQVFGNSILFWGLPIFTGLTDGLSFPLRDDAVELESVHSDSNTSTNGIYYSCSSESVATALYGSKDEKVMV